MPNRRRLTVHDWAAIVGLTVALCGALGFLFSAIWNGEKTATQFVKGKAKEIVADSLSEHRHLEHFDVRK